MIRTITADTLRDLTAEMNRLNLTKDKIIEIDYTGNEQLTWICVYQA
jgi:hypothetical protein